jgi:hypothetical protein
MMIDPHDYTWDECLSDYRKRRMLVLAELKRTHAMVQQYAMAADELAAAGGFTPAYHMEFDDRFTVCALNHMLGQEALVALRRWFALVRVVHGRTTREEYHLRKIAVQVNINPDVLRKQVAQFMSLFVTKH